MTDVRWKTGRLVKSTARNIRVTVDASPKNARAESSVAINPLDTNRIVCVSKRFRDHVPPDASAPEPTSYEFVVAANYSSDGGLTWAPSADLPLLAGWENLSDPVVCWDYSDKVYILCMGLAGAPRLDTFGMAIYRSDDRGQTWQGPNLIHQSIGDDKGDLIRSRYDATLYAAWDDEPDINHATISSPVFLGFASSGDGTNWTGTSPTGQPGAKVLEGQIKGSISPSICVMRDGALVIAWHERGQVLYVLSDDHGATFTGPHIAASGIHSFQALPWTLDPHSGSAIYNLPGATFRVNQFVACCAAGKFLVLAWPDTRERVDRKAVTRIYSQILDPRRPPANPDAGDPLLSPEIDTTGFRFAIMPQLAVSDDGTVACAFHEYEPFADLSGGRIEVILATTTVAATFAATRQRRPYRGSPGGLLSNRIVLTDAPWDPAIDAPWAHGWPGDLAPHITFIGDYFGLDATDLVFDTVWTDTRTGIQELFFQRVAIEERVTHIPDEVVEILFGVISDGGGIEIGPGGVVIHVPPRGPVRELLSWQALLNTIDDLEDGQRLRPSVARTVARLEREVRAMAGDRGTPARR
jgi:hypothetical protein